MKLYQYLSAQDMDVDRKIDGIRELKASIGRRQCTSHLFQHFQHCIKNSFEVREREEGRKGLRQIKTAHPRNATHKLHGRKHFVLLKIKLLLCKEYCKKLLRAERDYFPILLIKKKHNRMHVLPSSIYKKIERTKKEKKPELVPL